MKGLSMFLPNPAPDLVGVCSALFELGGLIVIHDAAGCSENYTTYDEPRWFGADTLLYSSGLSQMDAVLGNEQRLIDQILSAAERLQPAFIAIVGSPVPAALGMDLQGLARIIEQQCGIPGLGFDTTGFSLYDQGIGMAFTAIIDKFCPAAPPPKSESSGIRLNILGATPLDFGDGQGIALLRRQLAEQGFVINSCWAMGSTLTELENAAAVDINLVVSQSGIAAARRMEQLWQIPWVAGLPLGGAGAARLYAALRGEKQSPLAMGSGEKCLVLGEQVFAQAMADMYTADYGCRATAAITMTADLQLLRPTDLIATAEDEISALLSQDWQHICGDPLYKTLLPADSQAVWEDKPHFALSSRLF